MAPSVHNYLIFKMMKIDILLGLQWGDEGKGKVVDVLTSRYDLIARFQGGPNAGHSLEFNGIRHVLHIIPSGIFHKEKMNIIGNGVVIDPVIFEEEIQALEKMGCTPTENLRISKRAHLILPTHRLLDAAYESKKGDRKIGSTLKGIGPTYTDKTARTGLRVCDLQSPNFEAKYQQLMDAHKEILDQHGFDYSQLLPEMDRKWRASLATLRQFAFIDSEYDIHEALQEGKSVLAEGAQGTLLDLEFGAYPFVTSSNTIAAGAFTGLGLDPHLGSASSRPTAPAWAAAPSLPNSSTPPANASVRWATNMAPPPDALAAAAGSTSWPSNMPLWSTASPTSPSPRPT